MFTLNSNLFFVNYILKSSTKILIIMNFKHLMNSLTKMF